MNARNFADVSALDERVFGANREAMLRWMWQGSSEYACVAEGGGRVTGYTFGRHGNDFEHLGPVTAVDGDTARRLATACLGLNSGRRFVVDVSPGDALWQQGLEALGFRFQRPLIRMARGGGRIPGDPAQQFAVLGPEFG